MDVASEKERLVAKLMAIQKHLGSLETEIRAADLQLTEMESQQREILRRKAMAKERLRIAIVNIESVKAKINGQEQ